MGLAGRSGSLFGATIGNQAQRCLQGRAIASACPAELVNSQPPAHTPHCRSVLGGTAGALLVLVIPGLVSVAGPRPSGSGTILELATGCLLLLAGSVVVAATVLRAMLFPAPP